MREKSQSPDDVHEAGAESPVPSAMMRDTQLKPVTAYAPISKPLPLNAGFGGGALRTSTGLASGATGAGSAATGAGVPVAAACRGAAEAGGIAVGILPGDDASEANEWCTVVVPTGLGHARNAINALAGDVLVVIGASAGTISEACFAWIHGRPLLVHSGFSPWIRGFSQTGLDPRPGGRLVMCRETDELLRHLRSWLES